MNKTLARQLLLNMMRIRRLEELCAELYTKEKIRGFLHLYIGEEAVATGVLAQVRPQDQVVATYREHGHALLKGLSAKSIMAEMFGKRDGCCRGRGGSMHLFSKEHNFFGGNAIVGGGLPLAAGLGLAAKMQEKSHRVFCFFGEGAMAEGVFHETMNMAALWSIPVIYCCENNFYAMGTALDRSESETNLVRKAECYKIKAESVDGMNVEAVYAATERAIAYIEKEKKPYFIEFKTYRFRPHSMFDPDLYRPKVEVEEWKKHCPIENFKRKYFADEDISELSKLVELEVQEAIKFAEESPLEPLTDLETYIYSGGSL